MMHKRFIVALLACAACLPARATSFPETAAYLSAATQMVHLVATDQQAAVTDLYPEFAGHGLALREALRLTREKLLVLYVNPRGVVPADDDPMYEAMEEARIASAGTALAGLMTFHYGNRGGSTNQATALLALTGSVASVTAADAALDAFLPMLAATNIPAHVILNVSAPAEAAPGQSVKVAVQAINIGAFAASNVVLTLESTPFINKISQTVTLGDIPGGQDKLHQFNLKLPATTSGVGLSVGASYANGVWQNTETFVIDIEVAP